MGPKVQSGTGVAARVRYESLEALDCGRYAEAVDVYERFDGRYADDPEVAVWRAEVATYLYRLDEAAEALEEVGDLAAFAANGGAVGHLARRQALLAGENALLRGEPEAAKETLEIVLAQARRAGDAFVDMRARLDLARVARVQDEWALALARAAEAARLAAGLENQYYLGYALWNRGVALSELGSVREAEGVLREAIELLRRTEDLRVRAMAQNNLAGLLAATERYEEARSLLESAEETLLRVGIVNDVQMIRHAAAWLTFILGDYVAARTRAASLLDMDRAGAHTRAELFGLKLLASLACVEGRLDDAVAAAGELSRLAMMAGSQSDVLEARMLLARARAKAGKEDAVAELESLAEEADRSGSGLYPPLVRIFIADAAVGRDPMRAFGALGDARRLAAGEPLPWVRAELAALERTWDDQPIRFEGDRLVIDLSGTLPLREVAHRAVDQALIAEALARTGGSYAKAGRLIGEQRWNTRHLARQLNIAPPAPAEGGEAEAN